MCDHGERCSGEVDSPPIQPCTRITLDVRGHGEKYLRRETHSLPNHDAKIALDMCDHGGCSGERETHRLVNIAPGLHQKYAIMARGVWGREAH